jgi:hypothetical protein
MSFFVTKVGIMNSEHFISIFKMCNYSRVLSLVCAIHKIITIYITQVVFRQTILMKNGLELRFQFSSKIVNKLSDEPTEHSVWLNIMMYVSEIDLKC